jgi:hypothetical protein
VTIGSLGIFGVYPMQPPTEARGWQPTEEKNILSSSQKWNKRRRRARRRKTMRKRKRGRGGVR